MTEDDLNSLNPLDRASATMYLAQADLLASKSSFVDAARAVMIVAAAIAGIYVLVIGVFV
jgi:hypothetical protein